MYAITEVIQKWHQYLLGTHFKIYINQKKLNTLLSQTIQTPDQQTFGVSPVTTLTHGINFAISESYGTTHHTTPPLEPLPSTPCMKDHTVHHHRHAPHTTNEHHGLKTLTRAHPCHSPLEA